MNDRDTADDKPGGRERKGRNTRRKKNGGVSVMERVSRYLWRKQRQDFPPRALISISPGQAPYHLNGNDPPLALGRPAATHADPWTALLMCLCM